MTSAATNTWLWKILHCTWRERSLYALSAFSLERFRLLHCTEVARSNPAQPRLGAFNLDQPVRLLYSLPFGDNWLATLSPLSLPGLEAYLRLRTTLAPALLGRLCMCPAKALARLGCGPHSTPNSGQLSHRPLRPGATKENTESFLQAL